MSITTGQLFELLWNINYQGPGGIQKFLRGIAAMVPREFWPTGHGRNSDPFQIHHAFELVGWLLAADREGADLKHALQALISRLKDGGVRKGSSDRIKDLWDWGFGQISGAESCVDYSRHFTEACGRRLYMDMGADWRPIYDGSLVAKIGIPELCARLGVKLDPCNLLWDRVSSPEIRTFHVSQLTLEETTSSRDRFAWLQQQSEFIGCDVAEGLFLFAQGLVPVDELGNGGVFLPGKGDWVQGYVPAIYIEHGRPFLTSLPIGNMHFDRQLPVAYRNRLDDE